MLTAEFTADLREKLLSHSDSQNNSLPFMDPNTVISGFCRSANEICSLSVLPVGPILKGQAPRRSNRLPMNGFS
jgi:hypothetical protein